MKKKQTGLSDYQFSQKLQISKGRLTSWERGFIDLPYWLTQKISQYEKRDGRWYLKELPVNQSQLSLFNQ